MIEDVAVADVMQLIRVGGHSGSLTVHNGQEEGIIGFENGRIVSAWNPRTRRIGELLVAAGVIDEGTLAVALSTQNSERPRRTVGHYLVKMGATTPEIIRGVMAREIERVVGEICSWSSGSFEFAIDDLTPLVEVTRFTGAPKVDLDTQTVLMDALRRLEADTVPPADGEDAAAGTTGGPAVDEGAAFDAMFTENATLGKASRPAELGGTGSEEETDGAGADTEAERSRSESMPTEASEPEVSERLAPEPEESISVDVAPPEEAFVPHAPAVVEEGRFSAHEPLPEESADRMRYQLVSPDRDLCDRLNFLLAETGEHVSSIALRDAGASLLGEPPPIVVVDLRHQPNALSTLKALCRSRPRAAVIALFEGRAPLRDMYEAGVLSVTSVVPETVVACMHTAARQRKYMSNEHAIAEGIRSSFARLRRIIADLRSGLLGTSVSSNLMAAVAESLDRGVLLVPHLDRMVALGAFGNTLQGASLARTTKGLIFPMGESGVFKNCVTDSRARRIDYDQARLPHSFREAVDRPRTGEVAVLPVPGSERVIAAVYMDNGGRDRPIGDIEIFELAAFQLGLALENEFLRRANSTQNVTEAIFGERKTG